MRTISTPLAVLFLTFVAWCSASAQQGPISADRPGFGTGTATVVGVQFEGGVSVSESGIVQTATLGEALLRLPLFPSVEARFGLSSYVVRSGPGDDSGVQDSSLGFKATLAEGSSDFDLLRPAIALLASTTLPTGDDEFGAESLQPTALLALGWSLPSGFGLGADINATSLDTGDDRVVEVAGGATLAYSLSETLGSFLELYTFRQEDNPGATYLDGGFTYLLSNDLQLDVNGGVGLSDAADDYFVGAGVAYRW